MTPKKPKMVRVTVEVTALDIKRGKPWSSTRCPIARALRRAFHTRIAVAAWFLTIGSVQVRTPARVWRFMERFDDGFGAPFVKPFRFSLWVPAALAQRMRVK